jgi:hypothetical protein
MNSSLPPLGPRVRNSLITIVEDAARKGGWMKECEREQDEGEREE